MAVKTNGNLTLVRVHRSEHKRAVHSFASINDFNNTLRLLKFAVAYTLNPVRAQLALMVPNHVRHTCEQRRSCVTCVKKRQAMANKSCER